MAAARRKVKEVVVLKEFYDLKAKVNRRVGDVFEASAQRVGEINSSPAGPLVADAPEETDGE